MSTFKPPEDSRLEVGSGILAEEDIAQEVMLSQHVSVYTIGIVVQPARPLLDVRYSNSMGYLCLCTTHHLQHV